MAKSEDGDMAIKIIMIIYITFYRQVSIVYYNNIIKLAVYNIYYT
jgi:hypothetical protein